MDELYATSCLDILADIRAAMSRAGDFDSDPEDYANESNFFEVLGALEALTIEGELRA